MANEEHLKILHQGVEVWNRWRKENPEIVPDLSGANLSSVNLTNANLSGANLSGTNLSEVFSFDTLFNKESILQKTIFDIKLSMPILNEENINEENINGANLSRANLSKANLIGANLSRANLSKADLSNAIMIQANLSQAYLSEANLSEALLHRASLSRANLTLANLRGADLKNADLSGALITGVIFNNTNLQGQDLSRLDLTGIDFQNANLQTARLINAKLDGANLTNARLWETQRAGWSIKGVICESIFWDEKAAEKTVYAPGEFERLFADQTKIRLFYKDGITPLEIATLPTLIQHLTNAHPEGNLRFVNIHEDSGGAVVELAIEDTKTLNHEQIRQLQIALQVEAQAKVEYQRQALIERETRLQLEGEVKRLDSFVDKLLLTQGNTFINNGQAGAIGDNSQAHGSTSNQIVNAEHSSVGTQIQGECNVAIADASDGNVITGENE